MLQRIADEYGFADVDQLVKVTIKTALAGVLFIVVLIGLLAVGQ